MTEFDSFITLDEAETLVMSTGEWRGTTVEYSNDGNEWVDAWAATDEHQHPQFARATVKRKIDGDLVSRAVVVRWDEYVPDEDDDRRENWDRMPTVLLGKVAVVSCYRGVFRDVIGQRYEYAERDKETRGRRSGPVVTPEESAAWQQRIADAKTPDDVTAVHAAMLKAHQATEELDQIVRDRLNALVQAKPRPRKS